MENFQIAMSNSFFIGAVFLLFVVSTTAVIIVYILRKAKNKKYVRTISKYI